MDSIHDFAPEIQKRLHDFTKYLEKYGFTRPEVKNCGSILYGLLKKPGIHVTTISSALSEDISLKKTWERLRRLLGKPGLGKRLQSAHTRKNKRLIRQCRYCVIDGSDIQKDYAEKMEGLGRVRDGDKSTKNRIAIGNGYWLMNAVMVGAEQIIPVASEVYSVDYEGKQQTSENKKLLDIVRMIHNVHPDVITVIDRGGDRNTIFNECFERSVKFVVRCNDRRHLRLHCDSSKGKNIKKIANSIKAKRRYKSSRGKIFYLGYKTVYWKQYKLVLVAAKNPSGGLSWYLTNITGNPNDVMDTVMDAYGARWRIEEYNRQMKQDYNLEAISLRTYDAIKNMVVFVMLASSFCAKLPWNLLVKICSVARLLTRRKIKDIPSFYLYKAVRAVAAVLEQAVTRRYKPLRIRKRDSQQYELAFHDLP